jgi:glycosyltransferase involved in cell wall biosynthesis
MKTSIAMATYNGAKYLQQQLDSFVMQTHLPDELVVCDDCSTDGTIEMLDRFQKEAPFKVRIHQNSEILGYTQNFNKAIEHCQGDIILVSDQDDVWLPKKIRRVLATFSENPDAGYIFSDAILVDDKLAPIGYLWTHINFTSLRSQNYADGNQVEVMLSGGNFVFGNTLAFRASLCGIILPIESSSMAVTHDTWISMLLSSIGSPGVAISEALLLYRQHSQQVVGVGRRRSIKEKVLNVMESKQKLLLEKARDINLIRNRVLKAPSKKVDLLDDHIAHLEVRASLSDLTTREKIRSIYLEYKSGRYSKYSSSLKSALRDFIFSNKVK